MSLDTPRNEYWKPYVFSMYCAMICNVQLNFAGKPTSAGTWFMFTCFRAPRCSGVSRQDIQERTSFPSPRDRRSCRHAGRREWYYPNDTASPRFARPALAVTEGAPPVAFIHSAVLRAPNLLFDLFGQIPFRPYRVTAVRLDTLYIRRRSGESFFPDGTFPVQLI